MKENYYAILGINENADLAAAKNAFRNKAKQYHPDINTSPNAHEEFILLNEAYEFVKQLIDKKTIVKEDEYGQFDEQFYHEWLKNQRENARKQASRFSRMKYNDFTNSPYYKSTVILSSFVELMVLFVGILAIVIPIYSIINRKIHPDRVVSTITGTVLAVILGICFVVTILYHNPLTQKVMKWCKKQLFN